jgi:hypothetical protein
MSGLTVMIAGEFVWTRASRKAVPLELELGSSSRHSGSTPQLLLPASLLLQLRARKQVDALGVAGARKSSLGGEGQAGRAASEADARAPAASTWSPSIAGGAPGSAWGGMAGLVPLPFLNC